MNKLAFVLFFLFTQIVSIAGLRADQKNFKLGIIAPLSGPLAEYGTAVKNGFEYARREKPDQFAHIDFIFEDDQYDGKKSIAAFNKLLTVDKVDLIYLWGTGPAQAVSPIAESRKVPLVIMSIDPSPALGRKWVIRFGNYSEQYILAMLDFLRANSVKSIGLLQTELGYTNSMVEALRANLRADESLTEISLVQPGETDLKTGVAKLSKHKIDALAVYLMSGQISQFYRTIGDRLSSRLTFGTDFFESMSEVKNAGPAIIGAVFPNNAIEGWFAKQYKDSFGNDIQITFAANSYDFALLILDNFANGSEYTNSESILSSLRNSSSRKGASGEFRFVESDKGGQYFEFPIVIRKIEKNSIVTIK